MSAGIVEIPLARRRRDLPRGVYRSGPGFKAVITIKGTAFRLGSFATVAAAAAAYATARDAAIASGDITPDDRTARVSPGGWVEIPLAGGKGVALVDNSPEILAVVLRRKWCLSDQGYAVARAGERMVKLHRLVWQIAHGEAPAELDHIHGQRLDNRIGSLRPASRSLQLRNTRKFRGTLPPGVDARGAMFEARSHVSGVLVRLGSFTTAEAAAAVASIARDRLISIEALRAAAGLDGTSDEPAPPAHTPERRTWAAAWRERLTAPATITVIDLRPDRPGAAVSEVRQRTMFEE